MTPKRSQINNFTINSYQELSSTNDFARQELLANRLDENSIIIANKQTKGKGRKGRVWVSSDEGNLYFSLLISSKLPPKDAPKFSFVSAIALSQALQEFGLKNIQHKWPNDVLISKQKIAGILSENLQYRGKNYLIIGIGLNLISSPKLSNAKFQAASLKDFGCNLSKDEFLESFLQKFTALKEKFEQYGFTPIKRKFVEKIYGFDEQIQINLDEKQVSGILKDMDDEGNLILDVEGEKQIVSYGEII